MKLTSEMLYQYICKYCKPNILINFCMENYMDADSNAFLIEDITFGVQLVKDEFENEKATIGISTHFSVFLEAVNNNSIDIFCKYLLDSIPVEHQEEFQKKIDKLFDDFNKRNCNPQSFYDIMREYRNFEEIKQSKEH